MLSVRSHSTFPLRQILTVAIGVCVMTLASKIQIPMSPVPFTFQTVGVLLIAMTCSPSKAFLSLLAWLSLGVCGVPVFARTAAPVVMGPTAGYLWGMLVAVTLMSGCQFYLSDFFNALFSKKGQPRAESLSLPSTIVVGCLGSALILTMGWLNLSQYCGAAVAWNVGVAPFIVVELFKAIGVAIAVSTFQWGKIGR